MPKISEAYVEIGTKLQKLNKGLKEAQVKSEAWTKKMSASATRLVNVGMRGLSRAIQGIVRWMKRLAVVGVAALVAIEVKALKVGMAARETANLFKVSMGKMEKAATKWVKTYAKAMRLNVTDTKLMLGTMNVMLDSMGVAEDLAFAMAKGVTKLTHDMSSFYDLPHAEMFRRIQSGLSGEVEPLKRLGIALNETNVQQWAFEQGLIKQGQKMTEQTKIMARYGALLDMTNKAQGDLARTLESETNLLRAVQGQWKTFLENLADASLEGGGFADLLRNIRSLLYDMTRNVTGLGSVWDRVFRSMAHAVENVDLKVEQWFLNIRKVWLRLGRFGALPGYRTSARQQRITGELGEITGREAEITGKRQEREMRRGLERFYQTVRVALGTSAQAIAKRAEAGGAVGLRRFAQEIAGGMAAAMAGISGRTDIDRIKDAILKGSKEGTEAGTIKGLQKTAQQLAGQLQQGREGVLERYQGTFGQYLPSGRGGRAGPRQRWARMMEATEALRDLQFMKRVRGGKLHPYAAAIEAKATRTIRALGPEFGGMEELLKPRMTPEERALSLVEAALLRNTIALEQNTDAIGESAGAVIGP